MRSAAGAWTVELTDAARADFAHIIAWTAERFGRRQAEVYRETLVEAIVALREGPEIHGVRLRRDLDPGIMTLSVARHRRKGRHLIVFRNAPRPMTITVLRILHDAMDLRRHMTSYDDDEGEP